MGDEARPVFDVLIGKLRIPSTRPGSVRRTSLIERLAREISRPIVSVVAPAGYGKTTLLAQWAERSGQAVAWVSVDEQDNDPTGLLGAVARALDAVQPVARPVFDALTSPASSVPGSVVPRLGNAFAAMTVPVLLILDDVHVLRNSECPAQLSVLAGHVPGSGRLVLAGRDQPPLRVARLRAEGRIAEIGPADLALTREEAALLVRDAGVMLGEEDLTDLHRRTKGWAVGLYLAALYLREGGSLPDAAASFDGSDQFVSEYLESELLAQISPGQRVFLTRAAVLERMCGPLCEAALDLPGIRRGAGRTGPVEHAAGAAGSPRGVVPLSSLVPRHAPSAEQDHHDDRQQRARCSDQLLQDRGYEGDRGDDQRADGPHDPELAAGESLQPVAHDQVDGQARDDGEPGELGGPPADPAQVADDGHPGQYVQEQDDQRGGDVVAAEVETCGSG